MSQNTRHHHNPRLTTWTAAYEDRWAWMYSLHRHYAHLRDYANLLFAAGRICIEDRNRLAMDAFRRYMKTDELNAMAEQSYQDHYHYEIWEGDNQVAELVSTGHVRQLETKELLGAITHARPPEEGLLVTRWVDAHAEMIGRVKGLVIERPNLPDWVMRQAQPPGFKPKEWSY